MAGLPTAPRDQGMLAICVLAVLGAGAYWYFVDSPKQDDLAKIAAHVDTLEASNQKAKVQLSRGSVIQIKQEAESLRANLDVMRTLVPASNEVPTLVNQVSTAARRVKLDLAGIDPEPPIEGEMFDTYRFRLKLTASYHQVGEVLANIGQLNRIIAPINLSMVPPSGAVKPQPGKQIMQATFEIQTYVVRTAPPKAKEVPKKATGKKEEGGP